MLFKGVSESFVSRLMVRMARRPFRTMPGQCIIAQVRRGRGLVGGVRRSTRRNSRRCPNQSKVMSRGISVEAETLEKIRILMALFCWKDALPAANGIHLLNKC